MKATAKRDTAGPAPHADETAKTYLTWLAGRRLIDIPEAAIFRLDGIWSGYGPAATLLLAMPGYGVSEIVTMETVDDAGQVVRSQRLAVAPNGAISLKAEQVLTATGLTKGRKPRPEPRRNVLDPAQALYMSAAEMSAYCASCRPSAPAETVEAIAAPVVETIDAPAEPITQNPLADSLDNANSIASPSPDVVAALTARIASLEAVVGDLMVLELRRGNAEATPAHGNETAATPAVAIRDTRPRRLRLVRRYLAMRAQRKHAVAQWAIGQVQYDDMKARAIAAEQRVEVAEHELSEMSGQLRAATARAEKAEAIAAGLADETQGRLVRLERDVATWRRRAEASGYKAPAFQLGALLSGRPPAVAA
jgi:hypothetical protein